MKESFCNEGVLLFSFTCHVHQVVSRLGRKLKARLIVIGEGCARKKVFHPQDLELWNEYQQHQGIHLVRAKTIRQELNPDPHDLKPFNIYTRNFHE